MPADSAWSLQERPGFLRLHSLPGLRPLVGAQHPDAARDRAALHSTTALETAGCEPGDVAGLALFNWP